MTPLPHPWLPVDGVEAVTLEDELRREVSSGHSRQVRAVARRSDRDDVAFIVEDAGLCVVHLTWRQEKDPAWPQAVFVASLSGEGG